MGVTMTRKQIGAAAIGAAVLLAAVVALVLARDDGGEPDPGPAPGTATSTSSALPVTDDATWCAGWQELVAVQGSYVAAPGPESAAQLLAVVDGLQALGAPESLDPAGYTEMTAVLDDVRASADPSFTPSVEPSEPADVATGGAHEDHDEDEHAEHDEDEHAEHDEHEDHGVGADEAPFGAWLAEHCSG